MTGTVRNCEHGDIAAVAELFQRTFRNPRTPASESLKAYLRDLFLEHPWADPDIASRVYVDDGGNVGGFIGVLPTRMSLRGRPLRAAVAGTLMVEKPRENPIAGARLLRSVLNGPQDLSVSETANALSRSLWETLGDKPLPAYSMDWLRVLRPAGAAVALASEGVRAARLLRPLGALGDAVADRVRSNQLRPAAPAAPVEDVPVSDAALIGLMPDFVAGYALRPDWDEAALRWFLAHAAEKERHGNTFRRAVYGKGGAPLGCYLAYGRPRGIAWVLQILARPDAVGTAIDSMFAQLYAQGCVAVRGRAHPMITEALLRRSCLFYHRTATLIHTANADLRAAVQAGDALLAGLAGESWTRLIGGRFA